MKSKNVIEKILKENKSLLHDKYKVEKIGLFGSYARGEESEKSDIDILVKFYAPIGWEFIDLKDFLEEILNRKVNLVTIKASKPQLKDEILKEVVFA
jgi:predicted nucleotidyltransferase